MAWPHAGLYGPQALLDATGEPQPGRAVTVRVGGVLATLYTDRDRTGTLGNPVTADARGNLTFYADPGTYTFDDGVLPWTDAIYPDPEDVGGAGGGPPAAHAATHATAGDDPVTPGSIGAATVAALTDETTARAAGDASLDGRLDALEPAGTIIREGDPRLTDARLPEGGAGGVLSGAYPNPGFAVDMATQAELDAQSAALASHAADTTDVHGIANTAQVALRNAANTFTAGTQAFPRDTGAAWGAVIGGGLYPPGDGNAGLTASSTAGAASYVVLGVAQNRSVVLEWSDGSGVALLYTSDSASLLHIQNSGGAARIGSAASVLGFFGATGGTRPTVTGSRGSGAATASLLSALASLGLIIDNSTA